MRLPQLFALLPQLLPLVVVGSLRLVSVDQIGTTPAGRSLDGIECRHDCATRSILSLRIDHLQFGQGKDEVILPQGQLCGSDADIASGHGRRFTGEWRQAGMAEIPDSCAASTTLAP